MCVSYLKHLPCDELMTRLTLNSKMDLVVLLTVGGAVPEWRQTNPSRRDLTVKYPIMCEPPAGLNLSCLLADVLPSQDFVAGLTLKAAQMPLSVQS